MRLARARKLAKARMLGRNRPAITLRRYTSLICVFHMLREKCLTLVSPDKWDDCIDSFFMSEFKKRRAFESVFALCFTNTHENYHHWRVLGHGIDGVCVEFKRKALTSLLKKNDQI